MLVITFASQLQEAFEVPLSVIFIHFDWSGQSFASLRIFEEMEESLKGYTGGPTFYRFNPDESPDVCGLWMVDETFGDLSGRGYGSVIWLRSGKVVDFEYYGAKAGIASLLERTKRMITNPP